MQYETLWKLKLPQAEQSTAHITIEANVRKEEEGEKSMHDSYAR